MTSSELLEAPARPGPVPAERAATGLDALPGGRLARLSATEIVTEALQRLRDAGVTPPPIDWEAIFSAGDDGASDTQRVGRVMLAAGAVAAELERLHPERVVEPVEPVAARAFTWVRNIGLLMLLFVAWQLWGTSIQEHYAQSHLASNFATTTKGSATPTTVATAPSSTVGPASATAPAAASKSAVPTTTQPVPLAAGSITAPAAGGVVGKIAIPRISLTQYVVEGTDESQLALGPGHYAGTPLPGEQGNVAIAGHRTTYGAPFNHLAELKVGDPIYLTSLEGIRYRYVVAKRPFSVLPTDLAVLDDFGDDRLTLTTCTPEFSAAERLVVVALLPRPPVATPAPGAVAAPTSGTASAPSAPPPTTVAPGAPAAASESHPIPVHLVESSVNSWDLAHLPVVLLVGAILVALGLAYRRVRRMLGMLGSTLVLIPIWAVGVYLLFEALGSVLPPNL